MFPTSNLVLVGVILIKSSEGNAVVKGECSDFIHLSNPALSKPACPK